jgi:hypothetical protein
MKQFTMFEAEQSEAKKYSAKIEAPIYEPKKPAPDAGRYATMERPLP